MRTDLWRITLVDRRNGEIIVTETIVAKNKEEAAFKIGADCTIREYGVEYDDIEMVFEHVSHIDLKQEAEPTPVKIVEE